MKRLLIVSPHFPPINAPDMQRVRMSLPYYREHGWEVVVLAVGAEAQDGIREEELLATLPADVRIVRTGALPFWLSRLLGVGNLGLRAWPYLYRQGSRLLRRERFDLVFFSNTQFVTFVLGPLWRWRFGVPYVLDVQDPWRTDYYERPGSRRPPGRWKYQFARLTAWALEGWSFTRASGVISVSPGYLEDFRARYPRFGGIPAAVVRFGASRADLDLAQTLPPPSDLLSPEKDLIHLVYTGASGPVMPHALLVLFTSLAAYRARAPEQGRRFRLHFVGTSYAAPGKGAYSVLPVAEQCGVADQVAEIPHRVGFLTALKLQESAHGLLLLGSSDLSYSPSKAYFYYLTGRPILAVVFRDSVMETLLDELDCAAMARFTEAEPKPALEAQAAIHRFFDLAVAGFPAGSLPARNEAFFNSAYLAEELTGRQCELFAAAVTPPASQKH